MISSIKCGQLEHFTIKLTLVLSLPGLTGQSSIHGRWLLDRPVKPGDDSTKTGQPIEKCSSYAGFDYSVHRTE
jgi:hypothetical protein